MAKYLILIYGDEQQWAAMSPAQWQEFHAAHGAFAAAAGAGLRAGAELQPTATATTLRPDPDGRLGITDGPFLETKEVLGGFYLLEAADLDEAISLARRLPEVSVGHSGVEIRPVLERE
ncbi:YciI family protein [Micromonospora zhanjiangensis]|uniref:YciI family protein n=1 Tax=Micromonospora zhanjiangensis TaxID=1522057 RepID=A0ABV8KI35_9ACTN